MSEITERNIENGHMFSAYEGLFKKAKHLKTKTFFEENRKERLTKEEVYNHMYLGKDLNNKFPPHPWILKD